MKMARMVLRCGLVVLLCIALTPFCVLADEGTAVSEPVFGEINDKGAEDVQAQEETGEEGSASENKIDETQNEIHESEDCGAYAGNALLLEDSDEVGDEGSSWVSEGESSELQEGEVAEETGLAAELAIAEDGSADVEPRLYPDLFLVRKEQLTEVPDGWIGIYTAEDLAAAKGESGNYILMSDVDMSQFGKWDPWKHLGGTFDGNGHTISNLIIDTRDSNGMSQASEIGLFANDPDKGEILYAYLTDPEPDRMPAEGGAVVVSQELTIGMMFSNTGNVSLTVNMGALVNQEQLKEHNSSTSSHSPITDQIKAILGSANWKDTPASTLVTIKNLLGQGAIVASKLDANAGFVKFANGFTIQWGIGGQDNVAKTEVRFPIKFTTLFMANAIDAYWSGSDTPRYFANSVTESDTTKAVFSASDRYAASYYWFALGKI